MADFDTLFTSLIHQESRGKHRDQAGKLTTSPVGAQGITQVMPATARSPGFGVAPIKDDSEAEYLRFGRDYLGAMLKTFNGDEAKALAAYNAGAGTVQKAARQHGDDWLAHMPAETKDYVSKITAHAGGKTAPTQVAAVAAAAPALAAGAPTTPVPEPMGEVDYALAGPSVNEEAPPVTTAADPFAAQRARLLIAGQAVSNAGADTAAWQAGVEQDLENEAGFLEAAGAAFQDPNVMFEVSAYNMLKGSMQDEPHDPSWDFRTEYNKVMGTLTVEEREQLFEQGGGGQRSFDRAIIRIQEDRDAAKVYSNSGALASLTGQLVAGFASPTNYVSGAIIGRAFRAVGNASRIANALPKTGAAAGFVAENIAGNVLQEGMLDAMGERRTAQDYIMAAGMGAAFSVPFLPGVVRRAQADAADQAVDAMLNAAKERMVLGRDREADRDINEITAITREQGNRLGRIFPEEVDAHIREGAGERAPEGAAPTAPETDLPPLPANREEFPTLGGGPEARARVQEFADTFDPDAPDAPEKFDAFIKGDDWQTYLNDPESDIGTTTKLQNLAHGFSFGKSDTMAGVKQDIAAPYAWDNAARESILNDPDTQGVFSAREVLEAIKRSVFQGTNSVSLMGQRTFKGDTTGIAKWLLANEKVLASWLDGTPVAFYTKKAGGEVYPQRGVAQVGTKGYVEPRRAGESREAYLDRVVNDELMSRIALHELMHTRTIHVIHQFLTNKNSVPKEIRASLEAMERLRKRLEREFAGQPERMQGNRQGAAYAAMDLHEFYSQLTASYGVETRQMLAAMKPSPGFVGRFSSALEEVWQHIKTTIGLPHGAPRNTALGEALFHLERTVLFSHQTVDKTGVGLYDSWPAIRPLPSSSAAIAAASAPNTTNPVAALQAQKRFADSLYSSARTWIASNPIDLTRLNTLVSKFGSLVSDGVALARSKNPILQQMASLVAEVSTGAAGRRATVAVRATYLEEQLVGLGMRRYDGAYEQWKKSRGVNRAAGWWNDASKGDLRQQFDREVYMEIIDRRNEAYVGRQRQATTDTNVIEAADALEAGFTRALDSQKNGNTIGSTNLPDTSRGYITQALDGRILHSDPTAIPHLINALSTHWAQTLGWEPVFAKQFAEFYLERARTRALGNRNVDLSGAAVDGTTLIRETLEEMSGGATTPDARDAVTRALLSLNKTAGASQTKTRLDIDLLQSLPNGKRIMDYYTTNPLLLYRKYMHRVAGEVALTEFGVPGARGARYMREAVVLHRDPNEMATEEELAAYDRVINQILGRPVPGEVTSTAATNMRLFASMARLGGAGITQFQEVWNAVHHIGLRSSLAALGQLPKMIGEVGRLKKGQQVGGVLADLTTLGGDVGMRDYYMNAPLDAPDQRSLTHGDDVGLVGRLIRAGSHIQQRMSFMQGIHAAQHRAVAEQIVLKAAKMLKDPAFLAGNLPDSTVVRSMRDMGFDDGLMTRLSATVDRWAQFDPQGNLIRLDVTMMPDRGDAEAFMQSIHRGTRQIIQGTFVGETGAWAHNDWLKLMLQFRTFSVVAADKQFARTRMNHGTAKAVGMMMGGMAAAIPLHLARVQLASLGREDREEYVDRQTNWQALIQASMNYTALSGMGGDAVELALVGFSGWTGTEIESVKGRGQSLTGQIPAVGVIEQGFRVAAGKGSVHDAVNLLPGSRLPFMIPLMNLTKDSE